MNLLLRWGASAVAIFFAQYIIPGIHVSGWYTAFVVALFLGVLNVTAKPVLFLLTLPLNLITLGLFTFVINSLIFWSLSSIVKGFAVDGFVPAFLGALFVSLVNIVAHRFLNKE